MDSSLSVSIPERKKAKKVGHSSLVRIAIMQTLYSYVYQVIQALSFRYVYSAAFVYTANTHAGSWRYYDQVLC